MFDSSRFGQSDLGVEVRLRAVQFLPIFAALLEAALAESFDGGTTSNFKPRIP